MSIQKAKVSSSRARLQRSQLSSTHQLAMKPGNEYEAQIVVTTSDPENQMVVLPVSIEDKCRA